MFRSIFVCLLLGLSVNLSIAQHSPNLNILAGGRVTASGYTSMPYYLYDGDTDAALFSTEDGMLQDPAFIGIMQNAQMTIERIEVYGGEAYENGGWWDSSAAMPEIQILASPGADWTTVGTLDSYPTLDGTDMAAAQTAFQEQLFEASFDPPLSCVGIRISGTGASGNDPSQSFVSLNEFRAFGQLGAAVNTYTPPALDGALPIGSNFNHEPRFEGNGLVEGDNLLDGRPQTVVYCEELDIFDFNAFFGFYSMPIILNSVSFVHGPLTESGGWFNTETQKPQVQIRRAFGSDWETVGTIDNYPDTDINTFRSDLPADIETSVWMYIFNEPTEVVGVRFLGNGSFNIDETPFIQCGEIMIDGTGNPAYTGPLGTGRDADGNAYKPDDDGMIFIQAENARGINDPYRIYPHADAPSGLVIRGNYGPSFNAGWFSEQIIEFDIDVPAGDWSVFVQFDVQNGWTDSMYVTFDDQDPLTINGVSNDFRWVPGQGTPAGVPVTLERSIITVDAGWDFWTLDEGEHTLRMAYREPLKVIDWVLITQDFQLDIANFEEPASVPPVNEPPVSVNDYSLY